MSRFGSAARLADARHPSAIVPELESWLSFYRSRRHRIVDLPWSDEVPFAASDQRLIATSIATFQLGESSEGAHLIAAARRFGIDQDLPGIAEATELFIHEEQFHAGLLSAFMKANNIALKSSQWSDRVFRRLRHLAGFELAISVLIVAEIIALTYYRALAAATPSIVLKYICAVILSDEQSHVSYESTLILRVRSRRSRAAQIYSSWLHSALYAGAVIVVFLGHRRVLRTGGYTFLSFWTSCWRRFSEYLGRVRIPRAAPGGA